MNHVISRRHALRLAAAGAVGLAGAAYLPAVRGARAEADKQVSLAFIGVGARGTSLLRDLLAQNSSVKIPAICDIDEKNLNRALDLIEKARGTRPEGYSRGPEDYKRLLEREDINSVLIATPQELHAAMAIDSMKAGKFVGSEVPACCTVDECRALVRAQKETRTGYMMLENLLYPSYVMQVGRMVEAGVFGELTYGFGGYIHEIRGMRFTKYGQLTWRGQNVLHQRGIVYPTHAIGPVCRWMGINVSDKLKTLVAMDSLPMSNHLWAVKHFGENSEPAKVNFENGDTNQALIRTEKGRLIEVRYDTASPRPAGMGQYSLQGTKGAYESAMGERRVYIEGRSPGEKWEPLEQYKEYEHPRWKAKGQAAASAGHWGADYFVIEDFLEAIRTDKSPVDVIDAVTWSVVRPLSHESIVSGNKPVEVPDFSAGT
jgi:predicted dehydrogenase